MIRNRLLAVLSCVLLLPHPLPATWSIIIVDTRTGEIAIGSATCLSGFDLRAGSPVVVVGVGAAAAQSYVDVSGMNRLLIRDLLLQGVPPWQILSALASQDPGFQTRQYGIVDTQGRRIGFTGSFAGPWAGHLTGGTGTLVWAIQGNVITGEPVLTMAEQAILNTPGDLAAKLMAAMQAARQMGGDGRCSCSPSNPPGCGSPPPSFTKSAHIGYMIVARQGDQDGPCNANVGCAAGTYYLNHNIAFQSPSAPDPVIQLQSLFNTWRANWIGRPDHHLSSVTLDPPTLPANGSTSTTATVVLRDWQGTPLNLSGASLTVTPDTASTTNVQIGAVTALGNGTFTFLVTAGMTGGEALLRVQVDDGLGSILLSPRTLVPVLDEALWASAPSLSAAAGGVVHFLLDAGPAQALRPYALALSGSGSTPGIIVSPVLTIPLQPDPLFYLSLQALNSPWLPNTLSLLDPSGASWAQLAVPPSFLAPLQGGTLTLAFATLGPVDFASNAVTVLILP